MMELKKAAASELRRRLNRLLRAVMRWYSKSGRSFPWREASGLYEIIVAEKLLQQTRAEQAAGAYTEIMRRWPNPCSLSQANPEELEAVLKPLGFYRFRAVELLRIAGALCRGEVSESSLAHLPGVGDYISAAVLVHVYGKRLIAVDTNVSRVLARALLGREKLGRYELARLKEVLRPGGVNPRALNYALLDFGSLVCKHRRPECPKCPARRFCEYFNRMGG